MMTQKVEDLVVNLINPDHVKLKVRIVGQLLLRSSSIICNAALCSSSIPSPPSGCFNISAVVESGTFTSGSTCPFFPPSWTVINQFESERGPARLCQTPMWEFSVSSLRQVREGYGDFPVHLRSLALRSAESAAEDEVELSLFFWFVTIGKFVLAFGPLIKMAASSYARAASSAVSNVPSHTLLFLQHNYMQNAGFNMFSTSHT